MKEYFNKINEVKGKLIIDGTFKEGLFISSWLLMNILYKNIKNTDIFINKKYSNKGLLSEIKYTEQVKDEDLIIIMNDKYKYKNKNTLIINKKIIKENINFDEIEKLIESSYREAYSQIKYFNNEYMEKISYLPDMYYKNKLLTNRDYKSEYVNIINNNRYTECKSIQNSNRIHFFGDSRIYGLYSEDKYTIPSITAKKTNTKCINYATYGTSIFDLIEQFKSADIKPNDIVIINSGFIKSKEERNIEIINNTVINEIKKIKNLCDEKKAHLILCILPNCGDKINLTENQKLYCIYNELQTLMEANSKYYSLNAKWDELDETIKLNGIHTCNIINKCNKIDDELFVDFIHFGSIGNEFIAEELSKEIIKIQNIKKEQIKYKKDIKILKEEYEDIIRERKGDRNSIFFDINKFKGFIDNLKKISKGKSEKSAVIVMNANPFTNGHKYIIKESLKKYEHIYILVVQESNTVIPYVDRINLIKEGTKDLERIDIIPSSEFVVSNITLPEYFNKEKKDKSIVDASRDIDLFVNYIMPALNTKTRIAGHEPFCKITKEYNRQISERFDKENLNFIQINRKKYKNKYISARDVRRSVYENNISSIKDCVPISTYKYLELNKVVICERMKKMEV